MGIQNPNFTICSIKLARQLEEWGFKCIGTGINRLKPEFHVFYFKDSDELREAINSIMGYERYGKISKSKNDNSR